MTVRCLPQEPAQGQGRVPNEGPLWGYVGMPLTLCGLLRRCQSGLAARGARMPARWIAHQAAVVMKGYDLIPFSTGDRNLCVERRLCKVSAVMLSIPPSCGGGFEAQRLCLVGRAIVARMARPSPGVSISVVGRSICPWVAQGQLQDGTLVLRACSGRSATGSCLHSASILAGVRPVSTA